MVSYKKYLDLEIFNGEISAHEYPWHFHECYTLIIVEKGLITYEFHDKSVIVKASEALIIEPFKVHRNKIAHPTTYKAIFVPREYFAHAGKNNIVTLKVNNTGVVANMVRLFNKVLKNCSKRELQEMIFGICALIKNTKVEPVNETPLIICDVPKIAGDLTIKELAGEAHLSKFHFQRKFKKNCGLTIGQLKQQEKTIAAKILLQNGMLSTDVAYELGFFDQSHFIKYFKKMWATTPKNVK